MAKRLDSLPYLGDPVYQSGTSRGCGLTDTGGNPGLTSQQLCDLGPFLNLWETLFPHLENRANHTASLRRPWGGCNELKHVEHLRYTPAPYKALWQAAFLLITLVIISGSSENNSTFSSMRQFLKYGK